jgi:hypothetical protein
VTDIATNAFFDCSALVNIKIPGSVTNIAFHSFAGCSSLSGIYFLGNSPHYDPDVFDGVGDAIVYYLPGTTGWYSVFGGLATTLWTLPYPVILKNGSNFGVHGGEFGFTISWATNISVVVEGCANLAAPVWQPLQTNTLSSGTAYFSDPQWNTYPGRFYRLSPQ